MTEVRTNERTNIQTDERKDENYIPVSINAGGINRRINKNMSEKLFANMIVSLFYIIRQLFIQIMCKNQLIQVNRFQEIMNNVDLSLVLTHLPEEVRRLDLCR